MSKKRKDEAIYIDLSSNTNEDALNCAKWNFLDDLKAFHEDLNVFSKLARKSQNIEEFIVIQNEWARLLLILISVLKDYTPYCFLNQKMDSNEPCCSTCMFVNENHSSCNLPIHILIDMTSKILSSFEKRLQNSNHGYILQRLFGNFWSYKNARRKI